MNLVQAAQWLVALPLFACCYLEGSLANGQCVQNLTLSNTNLASGSIPYEASNSTTAGPAFTISNSAVVTFTAGSYIKLEPGFRATAPTTGGATTAFHASIQACTPDFALVISPASATISTGLSYPYMVTVTCMGGLTGTVTLAAPTVPSGVTAVYGASSLTCSNGTASTILTVSTTTTNVSSGTITVAASSGSLNHSTTAAVTASSVDLLQDLRSCVAWSGSGACNPLAPGAYRVSSGSPTIAIDRSGVTVDGGSSINSPTMLVRDPGWTGNLISVGANSSTPLNGVKIQNLTICGSIKTVFDVASRTFVTFGDSPVGCPRVETTCGDMTSRITQGTPISGDTQCIDVEIDNAAYSPMPSNPFTNSSCLNPPGCYSVAFANVDFEDPAGHGLSLYSNAQLNRNVNDIYIHDSTFNNSAITGILYGKNCVTPFGVALSEQECRQGGQPGGPFAGQYDNKFCDGYQAAHGVAFADASALYDPRNVRIENNHFTNALTGAMGGDSGRWFGLRNNTFVNNYLSPQVGNPAGGTIELGGCIDQVEISHNTFVGPNQPPNPFPAAFPGTEALEIYGRNFNVHDNTISHYAIQGMGPSSVHTATITTNNISNVDSLPPYHGRTQGGIQLVTSFDTGGCDAIPRDVQSVTITGNTVTGQNYGIVLGDQEYPSRLTLSGVMISSNTLGPIEVGVDPTISFPGYSGPTTTSARGTALIPTPRALGVDAVSPVPQRCTGGSPNVPGSVRETFKFAGHENTGSNNVQWIQGLFSLAGDDYTGSGGPDNGAKGCHFMYFTQPGVLYLDGDDGGYMWVGSSIVGTGGGVLANSYCRIYAGSASSVVTTEAYVVNLSLDIEFIAGTSSSPLRKHIYSTVGNMPTPGNPQGTVSNGGVWNYWGWWTTP